MTLKAGRVRAQSGRNRKRDAAPRGFMTDGAVDTHPRSVARVIEDDIKALERGERLDRAARRIRMTDRAQRAALISELLRVTARAGRVSGQSWSRRVINALVAQQTGQPRVTRLRVRENRKVPFRIFRHYRIRLFGHR